MDKETSDAIQKGLAYLSTVAIALGSGVVKYLQRFTADPRPPFDWIVFLIQVGTSILAGLVADWLFTAWHSDTNLTNAAVALAGWGGAEFIAWAERKIRDTAS